MRRRTNALPLLLLAAGAGLIALGAGLGHDCVGLAKAIRICLECVGIG